MSWKMLRRSGWKFGSHLTLFCFVAFMVVACQGLHFRAMANPQSITTIGMSTKLRMRSRTVPLIRTMSTIQRPELIFSSSYSLSAVNPTSEWSADTLNTTLSSLSSSGVIVPSVTSQLHTTTTQTFSEKLSETVPVTSSSIVPILAVLALILQNAGLALLMRLSRSAYVQKSTPQYSAATAVFLSEVVKVIFASFMHTFTPGSSWKSTWDLFFKDYEGLLSVTIPAALYVVQNRLQYVAMGALPAVVYQVLVQGKLLATAATAKLVLGRGQTTLQWLCIAMVSVGVLVVQHALGASTAKKAATAAASAAVSTAATSAKSLAKLNLPLGCTAVGLSCLTSAYAGVAFERLIKRVTPNDPYSARRRLWALNAQISFVSVLLSGVPMMVNHLRELKQYGIAQLANPSLNLIRPALLDNFTPLAWAVVAVHAAGGFLVAMVVQYTSSVAKGFTSAAAILVSALVSALVLKDVLLSPEFIGGGALVTLSVMGYTLASNAAKNQQSKQNKP